MVLINQLRWCLLPLSKVSPVQEWVPLAPQLTAEVCAYLLHVICVQDVETSSVPHGSPCVVEERPEDVSPWAPVALFLQALYLDIPLELLVPVPECCKLDGLWWPKSRLVDLLLEDPLRTLIRFSTYWLYCSPIYQYL